MKKITGITMMLLLLLLASSDLGAQTKKKGGNAPHKERRPLTDVKSKEIVTEFPCDDRATIFLENILRRVNIRTTNEPKVRLVTTVYYQGDPAYTDAEWLELLHLGISGNAHNVVVKSNMPGRPAIKTAPPSLPLKRTADTLIANGIAVFDSSGKWVNRKSDIRRNIILYIPVSAKLDIESKYSDVSLENNLEEVKVRLANGSCTMMDVMKLTVNSVYGNIYAGNIRTADADIANGRFKAKTIMALDVHSKNAVVELDLAQSVKMVSEADRYEIEEAETITGTTNYGDLRVTALKTSLDLTGVNANVKLRFIDPAATLIKIDDKYADLRLPIGYIKNYTVDFEGANSDVYAPFEKAGATDTSFKSAIGTGKGTSFQLKCNNCTVDFK